MEVGSTSMQHKSLERTQRQDLNRGWEVLCPSNDVEGCLTVASRSMSPTDLWRWEAERRRNSADELDIS